MFLLAVVPLFTVAFTMPANAPKKFMSLCPLEVTSSGSNDETESITTSRPTREITKTLVTFAGAFLVLTSATVAHAIEVDAPFFISPGMGATAVSHSIIMQSIFAFLIGTGLARSVRDFWSEMYQSCASWNKSYYYERKKNAPAATKVSYAAAKNEANLIAVLTTVAAKMNNMQALVTDFYNDIDTWNFHAPLVSKPLVSKGKHVDWDSYHRRIDSLQAAQTAQPHKMSAAEQRAETTALRIASDVYKHKQSAQHFYQNIHAETGPDYDPAYLDSLARFTGDTEIKTHAATAITSSYLDSLDGLSTSGWSDYKHQVESLPSPEEEANDFLPEGVLDEALKLVRETRFKSDSGIDKQLEEFNKKSADYEQSISEALSTPTEEQKKTTNFTI